MKYRIAVPDVNFWKDMVPCQAACPVQTDAGRYVQLIGAGQDRQAYLTARSPNPLASICGRVCAAPCEDRCRRGRIDSPVSIRALKRFVAEKYGIESSTPASEQELREHGEPGNKTRWHFPVLAANRSARAHGQKVAVVGAGPAGLACAHDLAMMGYPVTIFEASDRPGGTMVHGIPEFRLSRDIVDKQIARILELGVELKLNTPLTAEFGLRQLRDAGYQAVFLGVGTQRGRSLAIEGADLDGVIKAIDFLLNVNHGYRAELGRRVLVIGGGFVAFDAARAALRSALDPGGAEDTALTALDAARSAVRSGAADVRVVSLESFQEMPVMRTAQGVEEFEQAKREGVQFAPQRSAKRFLGRDGRLEAVELIGVRRTYDENGRFAPQFEESTHEVIEADSVILAIGQGADLAFLKPDDGIQLRPQGTIAISPETLATSAPGVFAGGDVAFGPRNLIEAEANGKRAALSIDDYLRGAASGPVFRLSIEQIPTREYRMPDDYERRPRQAPPTIPLNRRTGIAEVEAGYSEEQARLEAERCLHCHVQTIYDAEKCVLCNRCVDVCPEYCLKLVPLEDLDLDDGARRDLLDHYGLGTNGPLSAMVKDDDRCIRCGLCAMRCPTGAMTMEVFFYEESEVPV